MRLLAALLFLSAFAPDPEKPKPIVLPLKPHDLLVCATYLSDATPRAVQRSCVEATRVREWILMNGRPADECP